MKAYELLADSGRWIKGRAAINSKGESVFSTGEDAVCWCVLGAINRCYPPGETVASALNRLMLQINEDSIAEWNDRPERTHAEVLEVLKRADV